MRDRLEEGDHRADENNEHHRVADLHTGIELLERVDDRLAENLPVEEAPRLSHTVGALWGAFPVATAVAELDAAREGQLGRSCGRAPSEELAVDELLDDRAERDGREEREAADDEDDADHEADEHAVVGPEGADRLGDGALYR